MASEPNSKSQNAKKSCGKATNHHLMTKLLAIVVKKVRESISFIHVHHYNHLFLPMLEAQTAMEFELCDKKLFPLWESNH